MRTKTIELYTFGELADSAKESALEHARTDGRDYFGWGDDWQASLKAFAQWIGAKVDWEVQMSGYGYSYAHLRHAYEFDQTGADLTGWVKQRASTIGECCPFTGFCGDEPLLDPFREFLAGEWDKDTELAELIQAGLDKWVKEYVADWDGAYEDEQLAEFFNANDYEFLADGTPA